MNNENINIDNGLRVLAVKVCGEGLGYVLSDGYVKIVALKKGVFVAAPHRIAKFNSLSTMVVLNSIAPYSVVNADDVVAKLEIVDFSVNMDLINQILFALSGNLEILSLKIFEKKSAAIIYTTLFKDKEEKGHTSTVLAKLVDMLSPLGVSFKKEFEVEHNAEAIDNALFLAKKEGYEDIFILPAVSDRALLQRVIGATANILSKHFAQIGLSDFIVAVNKKNKIIAVPYNYAEHKSVMLDEALKKAIIEENLVSQNFEQLKAEDISSIKKISKSEKTGLLLPQVAKNSENKDNVAGIILAAGISSRAGKNKLLQMVDEEPLFLKAVKAAIASKLNPVFVVLGCRSDDMLTYLQKFDLNILLNPDYKNGIKTSLALALNSLPSFCKAAVVIPADMPNITPKHLNNLLGAFDAKQEKQVCLTVFEDTKNNPVLWSKSLFNVAEIVPENANLRTVFAEHSDYTHLIKVKKLEEILDVNFPADLSLV